MLTTKAKESRQKKNRWEELDISQMNVRKWIFCSNTKKNMEWEGGTLYYRKSDQEDYGRWTWKSFRMQREKEDKNSEKEVNRLKG